MGGGAGKGGLASSQAGETSNATALNSLAATAGSQSMALFNLAFPGLATAESHASALASGQPGAIASAIAPAVQQVDAATAGAKQNILNNAPAGGEKNLALEQADVSQGAQIGSLASQGYNQSFNTLATLGQSGVGQGLNAAGTAIGGYGSANSAYGAIANQSIEQKGATLGAIGGLGGDAISGLAYGLTKAYA